MKSALVMRAMILARVVAPEDHRGGVVALDLHAQRFARPDQVLLPDEFIEGARAHAVGQRACALSGGVFRRDGRE